MVKYFDEDANEVEYDPEKQKQLEADLQASADAKTKLEADLESERQRNADLEKEVNPNWKEARRTMDNLKDAVKKTGAVLNEDGTIREDQVIMSREEISKTAAESASKIILDQKINDELAKIPEDKRELTKAYFNKLITGEEISADNIGKFIDEAKIISMGGQSTNNRDVFFNQSGSPFQAPIEKKDGFDSSPEGEGLANQIGLTYTKGERK
jgi:hypothetical protein